MGNIVAGSEIAAPAQSKAAICPLTWMLLLLILSLLMGFSLGFFVGSSTENKLVSPPSKNMSSMDICVIDHLIDNQVSKYQLIVLCGYNKLDCENLISKLDQIGFQPASFEDFIAWNKSISSNDRQHFSGHIITIVQPETGEPTIWAFDYDANLSMAKWGEDQFTSPPVLLITRKDAHNDKLIKTPH